MVTAENEQEASRFDLVSVAEVVVAHAHTRRDVINESIHPCRPAPSHGVIY